ncbi:hypothetical protein GGF50DRAFT_116650 [Schizophyllum commune]
MKLSLVAIASIVASIAFAAPIHALDGTLMRREKATEDWYMTVCGWAYEDKRRSKECPPPPGVA